MTPGEVGIADETQKAAVGHRVMSHHHSNPVLGTNGSTNGSTNGANGNGNGSQMDSAFKRSAADIVYRFGLDFALKDVVRSSAAAPTFFPREPLLLDLHELHAFDETCIPVSVLAVTITAVQHIAHES